MTLKGTKDFEHSLLNIRPPGKAIERRNASTSVYQFSASIGQDEDWVLANESSDTVVYFTTNATDPSDPATYDSGSNHGIPLMPFQHYPMHDPLSGSHTVKVRTAAGTAGVALFKIDRE